MNILTAFLTLAGFHSQSSHRVRIPDLSMYATLNVGKQRETEFYSLYSSIPFHGTSSA